ncbi:hypothetical protein CYMTET_24795, partial [Cymbomonas tetramitiformis]
AILGEDLRVEELVYDVDLLVLKSDNNSKIIAGMWPLAFRHVVYLLNRLVKAELGMLSSMDVLHQKLNTLRILIQLSLILGPLAFTMDVVTCFLNGDLDLDAPLFVRPAGGCS